MVSKGLSSPPIKCQVPPYKVFGSHETLPVILKCIDLEQY